MGNILYGQKAGGTHPTGMHTFMTQIALTASGETAHIPT